VRAATCGQTENLGKLKVQVFERILIVCTGNICRSPMAEYMLRSRLAEKGRNADIRSAGIGALIGHPADPTTAKLLLARQIDVAPHRARQLDQDMNRWAELILVMEPYHREAVTELAPSARGKTFLLGHWTEQNIPDPYRQNESFHTQVMDLIDESLEKWIKKLS
jgi:protein-tyrosine phosphatase